MTADDGSGDSLTIDNDDSTRSTGRFALLVAAGIMASRLTGLVRTYVTNRWIGVTTVAGSAFAAALQLPKVLQNLLGEGSLSASFIPVYAKLVADGREDEADGLAGAVVSLLALVTSLLVVVGIVAARPIVWLVM